MIFATVRKHEINEGFLVTGLLFPLILPPDIPWWQVAVGISSGVVIGKEVFGGVGMNILNAALTARAYLFFAHPAEISGDKVWVAVDGFSRATPLAEYADHCHECFCQLDGRLYRTDTRLHGGNIHSGLSYRSGHSYCKRRWFMENHAQRNGGNDRNLAIAQLYRKWHQPHVSGYPDLAFGYGRLCIRNGLYGHRSGKRSHDRRGQILVWSVYRDSGCPGTGGKSGLS